MWRCGFPDVANSSARKACSLRTLFVGYGNLLHTVIVLHAGVFGDGLAVWAEATVYGDTEYHTSVEEPAPYPFAADRDVLADILGGVIHGFAREERLCEAALWAPTVPDGPVPSSGMIAELPDTENSEVLPWRVDAYWLHHDEAIELLARVAGRRTMSPGVMAGDDMAYWCTVLRLAGSLVARQQFLPDIKRDGDSYWAVWTPVLAGGDSRVLEGAASRMPASCRALATVHSPAPSASPAEVLRAVTAYMTDELVRIASRKAHTGRASSKKFDSIHDRWLHALRYTDGNMGQSDEAESILQHVGEWRRPVAAFAESPFRLCMRLEEPAEDGKGWYVRYLVQPRDDPSLMVPVEAAWGGGEGADTLAKHGRNIREFLLVSLGQAAGICPGVAAGLEGGRMAGHAADTAAAHRFLTEEAPALEQAGFAVLLPAWWNRGGARLTARAGVRARGPESAGGVGLDTLLEFDWQVALGDQAMSVEELEELARLKMPLVNVRGQWVALDPDGIRSAIEHLKMGTQTSTLQEMVRMQAGAVEGPEGMEFGGVAAAGTIGDLLGRLDGSVKMEDAEPPEGFAGVLRPYQLRGYSWLAFLQKWGLGGCLADDMGLGKTIQVLAAVQEGWNVGRRRPALVVCPTSVLGNWHREAARFAPDLPVMIHHGPGRHKKGEFAEAASRRAVIVTSYGLVQRDAFLRDVDWGGVILDEAQNVKNPNTKQAKAVRALQADSRFALTGTPVENSVGDLWSIMEFLNPGMLGTQEAFRRNYLLPIQAVQDKAAADRLRRATGPFILRRLKTDKSIISDLPEKMEMKVYCGLTKEQATLYASVLKSMDEAMAGAEGMERFGIILGTLSKLKQVCNHPAHFLGDNSAVADRSGKLNRFIEMLEEVISVGDQALVFTQFVQMGHILKQHIQDTFGREAFFFHGGLSQKQRDRIIQQFQDGASPVLILSLKAGGTGLNITAANHVFHFDRWWNPAVENQATDRAFRIGQTRTVQVHKFVCSGTLEERIDDMIERKKDIAEQTVGTGEGWLTKLSNTELREVLKLDA